MPYTLFNATKNTHTDFICNTTIAWENSSVKNNLINRGANAKRRIVISNAAPTQNFAYILCISTFLAIDGKKLLEIILTVWCPTVINLFPASKIPFDVAPPNTPNIITEKLLYTLGIILLIKTSVLPFIVINKRAHHFSRFTIQLTIFNTIRIEYTTRFKTFC